MVSQEDKAHKFKALHERQGCFVIPNPWDIGTARILTNLGFEALASTSAGLAFSLGRRDAERAIGRDETIANAKDIVSATDLPVSADLENGYSDEPDGVAETIALAAQTGLVAGSIEDATGREDEPIYDVHLAVDRVSAAVEAARKLTFPFLVTARADNFLRGRADLGDTIARLQKYQEAGADVLYAPGLSSIEDIATVVVSVDRPVNVLMGLAGVALSLPDLEAVGVKRISVGSALSRAALGGFLRAAREIKEHGSFGFADEAVPYAEISRMF